MSNDNKQAPMAHKERDLNMEMLARKNERVTLRGRGAGRELD